MPNGTEACTSRNYKYRAIALTVKELPRAVAFYRDVLGLDYLFEAPNLAFFNCQHKAHAHQGKCANPRTIRFSTTRRTISTRRALVLKDRGSPFESEPRMIARMPDHELWMAFLRDSEGNLLALMSEVRESSGVL